MFGLDSSLAIGSWCMFSLSMWEAEAEASLSLCNPS